MKLSGYEAINYAEANSLTLNKYTDPTENAREGLTPDEARKVAAEDPSLIWCEMEMRQYVTRLYNGENPERVLRESTIEAESATAAIEQAAMSAQIGEMWPISTEAASALAKDPESRQYWFADPPAGEDDTDLSWLPEGARGLIGRCASGLCGTTSPAQKPRLPLTMSLTRHSSPTNSTTSAHRTASTN